jgi:hypothetical protein
MRLTERQQGEPGNEANSLRLPCVHEPAGKLEQTLSVWH